VALVALGGVSAALALSSTGEAQPPAPAAFCEVYPDVPACASGEASCTTCHDAPPALNAYGGDVSAALLPAEARPLHDDTFVSGLGEALLAVEGVDSDGDGFPNLVELEEGTSPSDATSAPAEKACVDDDGDDWNLCGYDHGYAFKKVMIDFCGRSPTLQEKEQFAAEKDPTAALHQVLDACLDSEHWRGRGGRVWNLANSKIGPLRAIKAGPDAGPIPLADYDDDYAFFVFTQTDDRDAREVLTGTTFVSARYMDGRTVYEEWDRTPDEDEAARGEDLYQAVEKERRAGLLTHRWFLMINTMFTSVPRTTAAQAYRAFLGYDISRLEGLSPVEGEPADYDNKGVQVDECAACHSTLDPLTYPFSRYEGIGGGYAYPYSYGEDRLLGFTDVDGERVADTPESGVIFGQEVDDLVEWAQVAANSEAFRRATVSDYWEMLLGEPPRANEQAEYGALVASFGGGHGHQVEKMLHDLIDTEAYGAP
jgi:hypothetical protein